MKESIGITLAIFEHDAEITKLRMINDQKDGILLALRTDVVDRDRHIGELRSTVAGRGMAIDEKNLQIAGLRSDVVDLKRDVVHRDKQISRLESTYDSMYSAMLDANQAIMKDLKGCQRDSQVLMQVVEAIRLYQDDKHGAVSTVIVIKCLLVDYLDVPEVPGILTLQTPSSGTRVVSEIDAPLTVSKRVMEAVQILVECDKNNEAWVIHTQGDAHDARRSKQTIDVLNETIADFAMSAGSMLDKLSDRARKAELYKKEINRLRKILGTADKEINGLSSRYCAQCDQLEKIEKLTMDAISYVHIDDIRKILKEK